MEKEKFREWWENNGRRGISFCECNYKEAPLSKIREWVQEFKGVENPIKKHYSKQKNKATIIQAILS